MYMSSVEEQDFSIERYTDENDDESTTDFFSEDD